MSECNYKVYLAAPIVGITEEQEEKINEVACKIQQILLNKKMYNPRFLQVPNAWNMPLGEWGRCVFTCDVLAIDQSEWVVVCDFGRKSSAGTAWEAGYAFGKEKKILRIWMDEADEESLMMKCGATWDMAYRDFLEWGYDFNKKPDHYRTVNSKVKLH